jgi:hypothetical protein
MEDGMALWTGDLASAVLKQLGFGVPNPKHLTEAFRGGSGT